MKYLIMHGSYGSPDENWFRWLESKLQNLGNEVILEQFPIDDWDGVEKIGIENIDSYTPVQSLYSWENFFNKEILHKINNEKFNFIGHSIAPIFMLYMLTRHKLKIHQAIFVAPFFNIPKTPDVWQFYPVNKTFYLYDFDFVKINKMIDKSYVIYGNDDPYVPESESILFAEKLASEIIVIPNGRHCGSNFKKFLILLDILKK